MKIIIEDKKIIIKKDNELVENLIMKYNQESREYEFETDKNIELNIQNDEIPF